MDAAPWPRLLMKTKNINWKQHPTLQYIYSNFPQYQQSWLSGVQDLLVIALKHLSILFPPYCPGDFSKPIVELNGPKSLGYCCQRHRRRDERSEDSNARPSCLEKHSERDFDRESPKVKVRTYYRLLFNFL